MKKGKSRNKRKKTRSRLLWIAIAVIGIAAVISAVCVAGMLATKENAWKTPEELLVEYMDHIPKQEYEEMYAMLHIEASGNVSQEDFVTRNSAIYEGIEVQNIAVQIIAYDEEQMTVTYQTSFDTVAGTISFLLWDCRVSSGLYLTRMRISQCIIASGKCGVRGLHSSQLPQRSAWNQEQSIQWKITAT